MQAELELKEAMEREKTRLEPDALTDYLELEATIRDFHASSRLEEAAIKHFQGLPGINRSVIIDDDFQISLDVKQAV